LTKAGPTLDETATLTRYRGAEVRGNDKTGMALAVVVIMGATILAAQSPLRHDEDPAVLLRAAIEAEEVAACSAVVSDTR
jgi:hypothetical protein